VVMNSIMNAKPRDPSVRKPWRKPEVMVSEEASDTAKINYPGDTIGTICTAVCHSTRFGSS
jgi:hypothetical protein